MHCTPFDHPPRGGRPALGQWRSEGPGNAGKGWRRGTGLPGGTCPGDCDET